MKTHNPALNYSRVYRGIGITEIILGVFCIVSGIAAIKIGSYYDNVSFIGTGIWSGVYFIFVGSFALFIEKYPTQCVLISNMVLSIITSLVSANLIGLEIAGAVIVGSGYYYGNSRRNSVITHSVLGFMGSVMLILSVIQSVLFCVGTQCCLQACCTYNEEIKSTIDSNTNQNNQVEPTQVVYQNEEIGFKPESGKGQQTNYQEIPQVEMQANVEGTAHNQTIDIEEKGPIV